MLNAYLTNSIKQKLEIIGSGDVFAIMLVFDEGPPDISVVKATPLCTNYHSGLN